jgi:6-pyruvoyltetrahydropterin/6-carboxytetrahydropterin synthase
MARHRIFVGKDVHKFSSAHMTVFEDGTKERMHGHNFLVSAAFDLLRIDYGAMLDFALVKKCLAEQCAAWDQRLLIGERNPHFKLARKTSEDVEFTLCDRRYILPADEVVLLPLDNIVVETLAQQFAIELARRLGQGLRRDVVEMMEVTVTESHGQGASYQWTF